MANQRKVELLRQMAAINLELAIIEDGVDIHASRQNAVDELDKLDAEINRREKTDESR